jgi:ABC-2 type transport system permease protein
MIGTIARKEMTEIIRDGRFRWVAIAIFALLTAALAMGWKSYRDVKAQHEAARRETRNHWLDQGAKNPHSAAHYGIYAFKPRLPLSLLDRGVDDYTGVAVWLEAHKQNEFKHRPAQDATAVQRMSELTAATVLQVLIPLVVILLSFSAFAGEREQGTLRQLLSLGVPGGALAAGKAIGIASALALLLIPATALGVIALTLASDDGAMALAVSARARTARFALIFLMAFWIINTMIAPRAVADLARAIHPTPSAFDFARRILVKMMNDDMALNAAGKDYDYLADANLWARVPDFAYEAPSVSEVLRSQIAAISVLVSWVIAAAVRRQRVE